MNIITDAVIKPVPVSKDKFSGAGLVSAEALYEKLGNMEMAVALAKKANFGLSKQTHATYATTIKHIETCQRETGEDLSLPFNYVKTLKFVGSRLKHKSYNYYQNRAKREGPKVVNFISTV